MPLIKRTRLWYCMLFLLCIVLGLLSRYMKMHLPPLLNLYLGDAIWAMMIFFGVGMLAPKMASGKQAAYAIAFCYIIELSQLYQAPWINSIRRTTLGGLVLGYGFLWTDILAYTIGIAAAFCIGKLVMTS